MTRSQDVAQSQPHGIKEKVLSLSILGGLIVLPPAVAQFHPPPPSMEQIVDASVSGRDQSAQERRWPGTITERRSTPSPMSREATVSLKRLKLAPPQKALRKFQQAMQATKDGKAKKAIRWYKKALKIYPEYIEAHNNLGFQYLRSNEPELAVKHLRMAVKLAPAEPLPYLGMAMALHFLGELDAALLNAEQAVKLGPTLPQARLNLGALLVQRGSRLGEAIRCLERIEGDFPIATLIKADAFLQRGDTSQARRALRAFMNTYASDQFDLAVGP